MLKKDKRTRRGFLLLETTASIVMILLLTSALVWSLAEYSRHAERVRTQSRAFAAADSVLNEIRVGVRDDPTAFAERYKGLAVDVIRSPGEGDWKGMTLVVVRVSEIRPDEPPRRMAELSGYVHEATP